MKKTKIKLDFKLLLILDLVLFFGLFFGFKPFTVAFEDRAFADELNGAAASDGSTTVFPYTKTFIVSAYYSPLPCQERYYTGGYESEIRLNGSGVRGADGSSVYPGMVAAPRSYQFGTKLDIPGVGIVAVHDRGGAIVAAGSRANAYDRLDIWMGYGDKGLARALNWGKRTVDAVVYGVNDSIAEQISLPDYSASEANPNDCNNVVAVIRENEAKAVPPVQPQPVPEVKPVEVVKEDKPVDLSTEVKILVSDLKLGDSGDRVRELQSQLKRINLYRTESSGNYDELTRHAVFKFQQIQGLVSDEASPFAGVFGPKTRNSLNRLVAANNYNQKRIAQATDTYERVYLANIDADKPKRTLISFHLGLGMRGPEVAELQKFLKQQGFFDGDFITQYYGAVTQKAVANFQIANKLINSPSDAAAGYVGPSTLELINTLS